MAQVGSPKPQFLFYCSLPLKRKATHIGARYLKQVTWCRGAVQRSGIGLHLSDKVILPTKRFVYPVSFTQREREMQE